MNPFIKIGIPVALLFLFLNKKKKSDATTPVGITVTKVDPASQTIWFTLNYNGTVLNSSVSTNEPFYFQTIKNYDFVVNFDKESTLTFVVYDTTTQQVYHQSAYTLKSVI